MITLYHFLVVGAILFCLGIYAVLTRKNAIQVLIGIELMLNASIINLVAFGKYDRINNSGQVFSLFVIVLAAASVAVALVIILNFFKRIKTIDLNKANTLKG
jgi:NADH:ubiquinone oxidoreductase subunit K